jgi:hypothetical protein
LRRRAAGRRRSPFKTDFHETRDTGLLLAPLEELWTRVPQYKPLSVGVVLLDLVPTHQHQPDLFDTDTGRRQETLTAKSTASTTATAAAPLDLVYSRATCVPSK